MNEKIIREKYALEYIRDILSTYSYALKNVDNAKYHHNAPYKDAPLIIKYGVLSMENINKFGIRSYSEDDLILMDDRESHVNGRNGVSLSIVGLTDLYAGEEEYDPFTTEVIDFLIDNNIRAFRSTIHYGNEFVSEGKITSDKIKSADIRLIKYIQDLLKKGRGNIEDAVNKYNNLILMSKEIVSSNKDIQIREMSDGFNKTIDTLKISEERRLILKK
ncbi:unknown [Clostridium sp. CAG:433]|jgi:hypothetical protein|nr:unknown [Clostridium sp. CAG:433]